MPTFETQLGYFKFDEGLSVAKFPETNMSVADAMPEKVEKLRETIQAVLAQ